MKFYFFDMLAFEVDWKAVAAISIAIAVSIILNK
jgi:hypothetical protein